VKLYNEDCLNILPTIPDKSIDLILTDPPYGTTQCKWDIIIPFEKMWKELKRIIKDNNAIILFGNEPFSSALRMSNINNYKYDWKWNKKQCGNPLNAKKQPLKIYEDIMVFNKHNYYPIKEIRGKLRKKGGLKKQPKHTGKVNLNFSTINNSYYPTSIIEISNAKKKGKVHPTQKPIALLEYLIKTYTNKNETVLDFTMGSGSTGVACKNLNRDFIGIEKDIKYFDIAKNRIESILL
jgi:site-specific DNA-methyltransferase (adenine-specific)